MSEEAYSISLDSHRLGYGKVVLSNPFLLKLPKGITAAYGVNGSGKTTFGTILEKGRYAYGNRLSFPEGRDKVKMLSFSDIHSLSGMEAQYYSQRMESTMNDMVPSVSDVMGDKIYLSEWRQLCESLSLHGIVDKKVNYLSSGELRKLLIINAVIESPDVLILDNPYIGLDSSSRDEFDRTMKELRLRGLSVILLLCDASDIPDYVDAAVKIEDRIIGELMTGYDEISSLRMCDQDICDEELELPPLPGRKFEGHEVSFSIKAGHVRYGEKEIIRDLDWEVRNGERWVLTGQNGSGKSLLLSLVCADNPQAYANDIILFDRKRGSGESIWEIKDAIGYVSPEMQLFFKSNSTILEIVVQGLRNSLNRYHKPTEAEINLAQEWLRLLGITEIASCRFNELSSGEQRLALVARAMIKQPELLVLDEPLHGLDSRRKEIVKSLIDKLMERNGTTLIFVTHYESEIPSCVTLRKHLDKIAPVSHVCEE